MSRPDFIARLETFLGSDVAISLDDPSRLRLWRPDPLTEDLVRTAVARAREEYPDEMAAITAVHVAYEGPLGPTGRRVELA